MIPNMRVDKRDEDRHIALKSPACIDKVLVQF